MKISNRWSVPVVVTTLFACGNLLAGASGVTQPREAEVIIAQVGNEEITLAQLEQQSAKLLQARYQYYQSQRDALQDLIDDRLLKSAAARENITVTELLDHQVSSKVKDPTDDQLAVYFEGVQTDKPFIEVIDQIRQTIRQLRIAKARSAYVKSLRDAAHVRVILPSPKVNVAVDNAPARGPKDALVTIIEFADYECPYCQQVNPVLRKLEEEFDGKVMLAYKHFPLPMHPNAVTAAEAAGCASAQGKFWEYHGLLLEARNYAVPRLKEYARTVTLDGAAFDQCLDSGQQRAAVQRNVAEAQALGLTGTPSFFVNGHFISGAVSYETLKEMVEEELAHSNAGLAPPRKGP